MPRQQVLISRKKFHHIRLGIIIAAVIFLAAATILWILSSQHLVSAVWSSILPVVFTAFGVVFTLCQWLLPINSVSHEGEYETQVIEQIPPSETSLHTVIKPLPLQPDISATLTEIQHLLENADYKKAVALMQNDFNSDPGALLLRKKLFQPITNDYPSQRQAIGEKLQNLAKTFFDKGDFDESTNAFELAIAIDRLNADEYFAQMGNCYLDKGNDEEAEKAYSEALVINLSNWVAYLGKSEIERRKNSLNTAMTAIDQAIKFAPEEYQVWNQKGVILRQNRRYDEALQEFERALRMAPNDPTVRDNKETTEKLLWNSNNPKKKTDKNDFRSYN